MRPSFRVSCRMAADDQTAWIQIVFAAPRSVLAQPIVQVLARRDAQQVRWSTGRPPTRRRGWPATRPALRRRRCLVGAERHPRRWPGLAAGAARRRRSRRRPGASRASTSPPRWAGSGMGDGALAAAGALDDMNTIALGLLAGWQVAGTIRDGTFVSGPRAPGPEVRRGPLGRRRAVDADRPRGADGAGDRRGGAGPRAVRATRTAIGAIACGYRFHREQRPHGRREPRARIASRPRASA